MEQPREHITFANDRGLTLAALLERPAMPPRAYALFAHCFTCGKDTATAARIARALADSGIAVLRFDFTGLGGSGGDFADTNFSSNVTDLLAAAAYLREQHAAPQMLIGHSLGGTAVLAAASHIPECRAVVTINAPAEPAHLERHIGEAMAAIEAQGEAQVTIAGKAVPIRRQFLEDLRTHSLEERIRRLKRALLIFHAPQDQVVGIDEAARIYRAALHPKSFISLDGADHMVSDRRDASYIARTMVAWADRYLPVAEAPIRAQAVERGQVLVRERNRDFLREVVTDDHQWLADEPEKSGGSNLGPDPYELLLASLGACTSMTVRMYANRKDWPLQDVDVRLSHRREHRQDCENCENDGHVDILHRRLRFYGPLDESQRQRLLEIANKCPVHRTLEGTLRIETGLDDASS